MKAASLIVELTDGSLVGEVAGSVNPLLEMAKQVRQSGVFRAAAAKCGLVLSSERPFPVYKFRCAPATPAPEEPEEQAKPANARARKPK